MLHSAYQRFAVVLILSLSLADPARAELPGPFREAVRNSGFIFLGTVRAVGKSTPTVPAEPRTAVVMVDQILESPEAIGNVKGREVTVRFREPGKVRPGDSIIFFTHVYSAGTSLGLDEAGWLPAGEVQGAAAFRERIGEARRELADEALANRLSSAVLVVLATAGQPRPTEEALKPPISEHDPLWWASPLKVETVLKGQPENQPVLANFPSSIDILWERSPRLKGGERGIFLLQPLRESDKRYFTPGLFLVDELDFQSPDQLERVRKLLAGLR